MWDFDYMHPIDPGMAAISDMVVNLVQQTALGLLFNPLGRTDRELLQESLPPPMHAGKLGVGVLKSLLQHSLCSCSWGLAMSCILCICRPTAWHWCSIEFFWSILRDWEATELTCTLENNFNPLVDISAFKHPSTLSLAQMFLVLLPSHLTAGNWEAKNLVCMYGAAFKPLVVA